VLGDARDITVYDDFAHHPTAIATTLAGLRARVGNARIVVAMEPRSNSMRLGAHADALAPSLDGADVVVFLHRPELAWDAGKVVSALKGEGVTAPDADPCWPRCVRMRAAGTTWCSCPTAASTARRAASSRSLQGG
jgi:UDP-N-acetylmuramate: L-alanyl-gamma-D-glutamyl-meso-diaminopimelate ligase